MVSNKNAVKFIANADMLVSCSEGSAHENGDVEDDINPNDSISMLPLNARIVGAS